MTAIQNKTNTKTLTSPLLEIIDVHEVDDAGGVHYETVMTAGFLVDLVERDLLKLTGNIRPAHAGGQALRGKTRAKVEKWARELLANNAVIGNISVRLNPETSMFDVVTDDEGVEILLLDRGELDCAVDSLSRIKSILLAAASPAQTFDLATRFQVRIWIANDEEAKRVAAVYNTRGDKVNDSAAKFAYSETPEQRVANLLMKSSRHLGQDNIEVLTNTVSASSHKLAAYNTLSQAIETFWQAEPVTEEDVREHAEWLKEAWDALVAVRPEFGRLTKAKRQELRGQSMAGTAVSIHGIVAVMYAMWRDGVDPATAFKALDATETVDVDLDGKAYTQEVDYFSYENPVWQRIGILIPSPDKEGNERLTLRMSFQTRTAMGKELKTKMGL
ncbi:DNA sulfur modification protein DndB [Actinotalea sp. K2]|uniref:DNA sulfur modification protein DndB n=1 Tax=Actinotalea sp. K2 TaxID=2939438 RepID=UPI002017A81F|nr:DNA sulfur modification protein DndB [Actinotalea sp. K2]MCL3863003.1 hypothetical protein [Actinotalea sp. K2]